VATLIVAERRTTHDLTNKSGDVSVQENRMNVVPDLVVLVDDDGKRHPLKLVQHRPEALTLLGVVQRHP
jgi:hypothetical protein